MAVFALLPFVFAHERLNFSQTGVEMIRDASIGFFFFFDRYRF